MGKRLDQQPMYPQYTYYYPHYLQTKVGYGGAGRLAGDGERSGANRGLASPLRRLSPRFPASVSRRAELVGRQRARERQQGYRLPPRVSLFILIDLFIYFPEGCWRRPVPLIVRGGRCG